MPKTPDQIFLEDARLKILQVLYESESPLRAKSVQRLLDLSGYAFVWGEFIRQVSWMVSEELIHCFPEDLKDQRTVAESRSYVAKCMRMPFDSKEAGEIKLKIRSKARHFIEGNDDSVKGVSTP